jgi:Icc-related predicted phosphoesterase
MKTVKILSLSDVHIESIYSAWIKERFKDVDIIIGCGDLAYYYMEYVVSMLNKPLLFVKGNHSSIVEYSSGDSRTHPYGGVDLHGRVVKTAGLIIAGVEGSVRYRPGPYQYSQFEMWGHVMRLVPALLRSRAVSGRYLDIFVTHAPPWGIHDKPDLPHQGIKAFRWFIQVFRPAYHFHGHIHIYGNEATRLTRFHDTNVINTYGYLETNIHPTVQGFTPLGFLNRRDLPKLEK